MPETHHGTTSGVTYHEYLTGHQFMEVRQVRTMYCGSLRFTESQNISIGWNTDRKDVRDNVETISPVAVSSTDRADKPGAESSISHQIATPSIPRGRDR